MNLISRAEQTYKEIVESIRSRDLARAEVAMLSVPQSECSVIHHFGPGLYVREVHMPAGILAIGHCQKFEHLNVFLKGRVLLLKDDGTTEELVAPMMFVGKPGRKAGYVLEDVVWQNIYATTETDIEKLETLFLDKSESFQADQAMRAKARAATYEDDRADYLAVLDETGISHETARAQSENESDQCALSVWRLARKNGSIGNRWNGSFRYRANRGGRNGRPGPRQRHAKHPQGASPITRKHRTQRWCCMRAAMLICSHCAISQAAAAVKMGRKSPSITVKRFLYQASNRRRRHVCCSNSHCRRRGHWKRRHRSRREVSG